MLTAKSTTKASRHLDCDRERHLALTYPAGRAKSAHHHRWTWIFQLLWQLQRQMLVRRLVQHLPSQLRPSDA
jgi:hypothetical protein